MAHITHPFDDTPLVGGYDATNLNASTVLDPSVVFDYDGAVPLSLNGMLSSDESLTSLGNLDEMDASSAAAAAASLDAFLADQSSNVPIVGMMPSPHTQSAMSTASAPAVPANMMSMPPQQQLYATHPQQLHQPQAAAASGMQQPQVGMQLAAGYPGYNIPPPPHPRSHSRAVGSHIQSLSTPPSASLFHYPSPSYGGAAPHAAGRPLPSYPNMPHAGYMGMTGDMASPTPSYGYPAYATTGPVAGVPSTNATISPTPVPSSSTVSSPVSEVTPLTPPLSGVPAPINTDLASVSSPASPQSPSSSSEAESSVSTRATAAAAVAAANGKDGANRKRKNRGGGGDKDDAPKKPVTEEEIQESKRQQRLMRNRASAQLSRERKKVYMKKLEVQLKELQQQNIALSQQLAQLKSENASLRARSESLPTQSGFVYGSGSYPGSPESHSSDGSTSPEYGYTPAPHHAGAYTHGAVSHKRTRVTHHSAAHHQMFQQIPPRVRAAGVVMFALMMSFTIFYNMAGIDFTAVKTEPMSPGGSSQASSPVVFQSRVLTDEAHVSHVSSSLPANEAEGSSGMGGIPISPKSKQRRTVGFAAVHTPSVSSEEQQPVALPPYAGADEYALVKPELPTSPAISPSSPIVVVKSEPSELTAKALELYDESPNSGDESDSSSVHSHNIPSTRTSPVPSEFDLFQQWKKMIVDANLTLDMSSSYMFCPGAIQMRPQGTVKAKATPTYTTDGSTDNTKESGIHSRLRRAGLPLPNSTEAEQLVAEAQARLSPDNNRLRFWVPTQSVIAGGDWDPTSFPSKVGLTEIECQVSGIRPVVFNTATPTTA